MGPSIVLAPAANTDPEQEPETLADEAVSALAPRSGDSVLLVVPDRTRGIPLRPLLSPLWHALESAGVSPDRITLAIASGTHRGDPLDIAPHRVGTIPTGVKVHLHDATDPGVDVGTTPAGTPVRVNRVLVDADRVLSLGGIAFHYFAGFGGGWKAFFPGLGERGAVAANHRRSLGPLPPGGLAPGVEPGRLVGNPVAEDLRDVAALLPSAVVWTAWDDGKRGAVDTTPESYARTCARFAANRRVGRAATAPFALASPGGVLGLDVVQAHKALFHASRYVVPGGRILFASRCEEGIGSAALERWLACADRAELEAKARSAYDLNAQTAISLAMIGANYHVRWHSKRPLPELARWGFDVRHDVGDREFKELIDAEFERGGPTSVILPEAAEVLPLADPASTPAAPAA